MTGDVMLESLRSYLWVKAQTAWNDNLNWKHARVRFGPFLWDLHQGKLQSRQLASVTS